MLLCNGVIQEVGISRRVENLKQARNAKEIDVAGKVVMPAFVDPDAVLVYPPPAGKRAPDPAREARLCQVSKHRLSQTGAASAADWVRAGVLSVGAHTGFAVDLRDTLRVLRIHQTLQGKPLRIRSIYSPVMQADGEAAMAALLETLTTKALPAILKRKLAAILEFSLPGPGGRTDDVRHAAIAAAAAGYSIRVRINGMPEQELLELALAAASLSVIAPPVETVAGIRTMLQLGDLGCVHVLQATAAMREDWNSAGAVRRAAVRREIDEGVPIAIASGFRAGGVTSLNPQFLLHLAVERCGMTVQEAIVASTYNAACSLRMSHVTGSLEPGKAADLLVMDVTDYRDLVQRVGHNDVQMAIRAGHAVYRRGSLTAD